MFMCVDPGDLILDVMAIIVATVWQAVWWHPGMPALFNLDCASVSSAAIELGIPILLPSY